MLATAYDRALVGTALGIALVFAFAATPAAASVVVSFRTRRRGF
jgi:hypothetical protein